MATKRKMSVRDHFDQYCQWVSWGFILLMLTAFPLFVGKSTYYTLTEDKYHFFVLLCVLYFAAMGVGGLYYISNGGKIARPQWRALLKSMSGPRLAAVAFLLVSLLAAIFSAYPQYAWKGAVRFDGFFTTFLYIAVFLLLSKFGRLDRWHLWGLGLTVTAFCTLAILQYFELNPFELYPDGYTYRSSQFLSTIGNINMVSGFLCLAIPLFSAVIILSERKTRWLLLPPLLLSVYTLALSNVDSGRVGMAAFILLMTPILLNTKRRLRNGLFVAAAALAALAVFSALPHSRLEGVLTFTLSVTKLVKLEIAGIILCLLAGGLLYLGKPQFRISQRALSLVLAALMVLTLIAGLATIYVRFTDPSQGLLYQVSQVLRGNFDDRFGSNRLFLWKRSLPLIAQHPILGTGPDSFYGIFMDTYGEEVAEFTPGVTYDFAHNEYIQVAVNEGLLGLAAYLSIMAATVFFAWKRRDRASVLGLAAPVVCYWAQAFFSFNVIVIAPMLWVIWGLWAREIYPDPGEALSPRRSWI